MDLQNTNDQNRIHFFRQEDNLEVLREEEENDDQECRKEELHELLHNALDEFNYSTPLIIESAPAERRQNFNMMEHIQQGDIIEATSLLKQAEMDELNNKLNNDIKILDQEYLKEIGAWKTKLALLEIEHQQKNVSLNEAETLIADKEKIIEELQSKMEDSRTCIGNLENTIDTINQDREVLQNCNYNLQQQMKLMEAGFPLLNKECNNEIVEDLRNKINQLEIMMNQTMSQSEKKEKKYKELFKELQQDLLEKTEDLAERRLTINELTTKLEETQRQYLELLESVEGLKKIKIETANFVSPLEEELRKIREQNEKADAINESVRKAVSEEFQSLIEKLQTENTELKDILTSQKVELEAAHSNLEANAELVTSLKDSLSKRETDLVVIKNLNAEITVSFKLENEKLRQALQSLELENVQAQDNYNKLVYENDKLKIDASNAFARLNEFVSIQTCEQIVQVSFFTPTDIDFINLEKEKEDFADKFKTTLSIANQLKNTVESLERENMLLEAHLELAEKRDCSLNKIQSRSSKNVPITMPSVGTDTGQDKCYAFNDVLIHKREQLEEEFDEKLNKFKIQCKNCDNLQNENKKLVEVQSEDREAVSNLAQLWMKKFQDIEKETEDLLQHAKTTYETDFDVKIKKLEQVYSEKCKKNKERFEKKMKTASHTKKVQFLQERLKTYTAFTQALNKIMETLQKGEQEVLATKKSYVHIIGHEEHS